MKEISYRLLYTGVVFPEAESLRDEGVGVGVLLLLFGVRNRIYIICAIRLTSVVSGRCSEARTRHLPTSKRN